MKDQAAFISLTPREKEVCLRIAEGLLNKQVGFELGTTEKTVKAQRARVMQKLGAGSLPDIVRLVERLRVAGAIPATPDRAHTRRLQTYLTLLSSTHCPFGICWRRRS